jgi:hypothetical protein
METKDTRSGFPLVIVLIRLDRMIHLFPRPAGRIWVARSSRAMTRKKPDERQARKPK